MKCKDHALVFFKHNEAEYTTNYKEHMIKLLWRFHNSINVLINKELFPYEELEGKYLSVSITDNIKEAAKMYIEEKTLYSIPPETYLENPYYLDETALINLLEFYEKNKEKFI